MINNKRIKVLYGEKPVKMSIKFLHTDPQDSNRLKIRTCVADEHRL